MSFRIQDADLARLNSLTKYPSIPTFHTLDPRKGGLLEEALVFTGSVLLTEKIDGTNARILCFPGGTYLIGSRGEFLLARGDIIGNPALGIVECLRTTADRIADSHVSDGLRVYYGEVYGGKVTQASKHYTSDRRVGFRLFDVVDIPDFEARLGAEASAISEWREGGGQAFLPEDLLSAEASRLGLPLTPRLGEVDSLPLTIASASDFLGQRLPESLSRLDDSADGRPEGIVARTHDRCVIAKLRFDDYRRTLKRREARSKS